MSISPHTFRILRIALFAFFVIIAVIAAINASVAVVLVIMGIGLAVLIVPPVVIHLDEHETAGRVRHEGPHAP